MSQMFGALKLIKRVFIYSRADECYLDLLLKKRFALITKQRTT